MNIYSIYRVTNIINNKIYIGFTSQNLSSRQRGHKYNTFTKGIKNKFYNAIRKYGQDNFIWDVIYQSLDYEYTISQMESYFIQEYDSFRIGYNSTIGGEGILGFNHTNKTLDKMKASHSIRLERQGKTRLDYSNRVQKSSSEYKNKMRKLATGKKHFYNPITGDHTMSIECPEGFIPGVGKVHHAGKSWFHNPITKQNFRSADHPEGCVKGRYKKSKHTH